MNNRGMHVALAFRLPRSSVRLWLDAQRSQLSSESLGALAFLVGPFPTCGNDCARGIAPAQPRSSALFTCRAHLLYRAPLPRWQHQAARPLLAVINMVDRPHCVRMPMQWLAGVGVHVIHREVAAGN